MYIPISSTVSVSVFGLLFLVLVVLDVFLYRKTTLRDLKYYRLFAAVLSVVGAVGMVVTKLSLTAELAKQQEFFVQYFDEGLAQRLISRFDFFAEVTLVLIGLFFVLLLILGRVLPRHFSSRPGKAVVVAAVALYSYAGVYSFYSIHKLFDVGGYISVFSNFQILFLHLPLALYRLEANASDDHCEE